MSGPPEDLLNRARELVEAIPNKGVLASRLKKEGYSPEAIGDALNQVFSERKALNRAGSLHEQALSRLLAGEELNDPGAAKALGRVARRRHKSFVTIWHLYAQKQVRSLAAVLGTLALSVLFMFTGDLGNAINVLLVLGITSLTYLCYATRIHRRYGCQIGALNELAERYGWWGAEGPEGE